MNGTPNADPWRILTGLLTAAVLALGSWVWSTQATLTKIEAKASVDSDQDERIKKFWKLHSWSRDEINRLRLEHDLPLAAWPDMD